MNELTIRIHTRRLNNGIFRMITMHLLLQLGQYIEYTDALVRIVQSNVQRRSVVRVKVRGLFRQGTAYFDLPRTGRRLLHEQKNSEQCQCPEYKQEKCFHETCFIPLCSHPTSVVMRA